MTITAVGTSKDTLSYGVAATFGVFFFNFNLYMPSNPFQPSGVQLTTASVALASKQQLGSME
jgi:hypothetical protein